MECGSVHYPINSNSIHPFCVCVLPWIGYDEICASVKVRVHFICTKLPSASKVSRDDHCYYHDDDDDVHNQASDDVHVDCCSL